MVEGVSGEIDVAEALVAEGVIAAGDEQGERDDGREGGKRQGGGLRSGVGEAACGVIREQLGTRVGLSKGDEDGGDENHEQRPEGIGGAPELLREEGSVDGSEKDERKQLRDGWARGKFHKAKPSDATSSTGQRRRRASTRSEASDCRKSAAKAQRNGRASSSGGDPAGLQRAGGDRRKSASPRAKTR